MADMGNGDRWSDGDSVCVRERDRQTDRQTDRRGDIWRELEKLRGERKWGKGGQLKFFVTRCLGRMETDEDEEKGSSLP